MIDPAKIRNLHELVAHAQVTLVTKTHKCYINVRVRETETKIKNVLYAALDEEGKRQLDPPPLKPRAREIKKKADENNKK